MRNQPIEIPIADIVQRRSKLSAKFCKAGELGVGKIALLRFSRANYRPIANATEKNSRVD